MELYQVDEANKLLNKINNSVSNITAELQQINKAIQQYNKFIVEELGQKPVRHIPIEVKL